MRLKVSISILLAIALHWPLAIGHWPLSLAAAQDKPDIRILTIGFPPYGIQSRGEAAGIYYELANRLAHRAGLHAHNSIAPYARIKSELMSGHADMTIMFKYEELEPYVIYISALPPLKTIVIGLKGHTFDSVTSLHGKKLAYLRGAHFSDEIDRDDKIFRYRTTDFSQAVKMLLSGRVDAVIGPMDPIISAAVVWRCSQSL